MPKDIIIRQYAHADKYVLPIIANPGKATGIHLLAKGGTIEGDDLVQYRDLAEQTRLAGLDVIPGCRMVPFGEYDNPEMWISASVIVRTIGSEATRGLFVFDGENYAGSGPECRVDIDLIRVLQEPLVEALNDMNLKAGWYPGNVKDTAMMALLGSVGGEAWGETSFASANVDVHNFKSRDNKKLKVYEQQEEIRDILPNVVYRSGFFDRAIRDGILSSSFELPLYSWVFDSARVNSVITGEQERFSWGLPTWHSGEEISSLNAGIENVFQFQPLLQNSEPQDFKSKGRLHMRWNRAAGGNGSNDPIKPRYLKEGVEYRGLWHGETTDILNLDQATISFEFTLPSDISGSFPLANSWWVHSCCKVWSVYVEGGQIMLSIGTGKRVEPGLPAYTFGTHISMVYAEAVPGEKNRVVFGYDATRVYLPEGESILLPDGKETNNIRSRIFVGYANQVMSGTAERTHYAREGTIWSDQLVRWHRVLTQAEMLKVKEGGRYPWGL